MQTRTLTNIKTDGKTAIILDTDAGLDDAAAILLAQTLNVHPTYYICTEGNTSADGVVRNVSILSKYLGFHATTVQGCEAHPESVSDFFGEDGLANLSQQMMDDYHITKSDIKATMTYDEWKQELRQYDHITYIAVAPLITLANIIQDPEVKSRIDEVYIMGGGIKVFNTDNDSEFNFHENPKAVQTVLSSGLNITLIPLDATTKYTTLNQEQINSLAATGKYPEYIAMLQFVYRLDTADGQTDATALHDTLPILYCAYPQEFTVEDVKITCDSNGHLEISEDGNPIHLVTKAAHSLFFDSFKQAFGISQ